MTVNDILLKLTTDNKFDHMTWIGKNYSIRDLKNDLKELENEINRKN